MAFLTRKEYAELCGCHVNKVNVYVSRKRILVLPNKLIDTENPVNLMFQRGEKKITKKKVETKRAVKREKKVAPAKVESVEKESGPKIIDGKGNKKDDLGLGDAVVQLFTTPKTKEERELEMAQKKIEIEEADLELRKQKADTEKAEHSAKLAELQVEKMMGKLMPVDLVQQILVVNLQDIFRTFENDMINIASIYCDILAGGDRTKLSEVISRLRKQLEIITDKVRETSSIEIDNVVKEYADVRSRGERK